MSGPLALDGLSHPLRNRIHAADLELRWIREHGGQELLDLACDGLNLRRIESPFGHVSAVELGNARHADLLEALRSRFPPGTETAVDLADQIQLCRAFAHPERVTRDVAAAVEGALAHFPAGADDLKVGRNAGDVLDPFLLAANFELLSARSMKQTIESSASHKVLMKIEDLVGHLHQRVIGEMRGNFRVPEPRGREGKERLDPELNPFPGADVGQIPVPERPAALRLFQVKSKTGSAKGGDGKRLGEQLRLLEATYGADTFYAAIVGNTLKGHRSKGAVLRESPRTAVLVGEAALDELTQSSVGGELLLRIYQRAFRSAAATARYRFDEVVATMVEAFETEAAAAGEDFLTAWLHEAIGGDRADQDSR